MQTWSLPPGLHLWYTNTMPPDNMVNRKQKKRKPGRPYAGGRDPLITFRLPKEAVAVITSWAKKAKISSRSEAVRQLVMRGLKSLPKRKTKR